MSSVSSIVCKSSRSLCKIYLFLNWFPAASILYNLKPPRALFAHAAQPFSSRREDIKYFKMGMQEELIDNVDFFSSRFAGVAKLYGETGLERLKNAHVGIVGLGGVGSWAVESIARSGVGALTLIDLDTVCVSNTNRQTTAMTSTIGKLKAEVLKQKVLDINPECHVEVKLDFLTGTTAMELLTKQGDNCCIGRYDCVLDAIDSIEDKCIILDICRKVRMPVVTVGAAGGREDTTKITVADLTRVDYDELLFQVRKNLRQNYDFPRGRKGNLRGRKWGVAAIFSSESVENRTRASNFSNQIDGEVNGGLGPCDGRFGTVSFVTGIFGLMASGIVIRILTHFPPPSEDGEIIDHEYKWSKHALRNVSHISLLESNYSTGSDLTMDISTILSAISLKNNEKVDNAFSCGAGQNLLLPKRVNRPLFGHKKLPLRLYATREDQLDIDVNDSDKNSLVNRLEYFDAHCHLQMVQDENEVSNQVSKAKIAGVCKAVVCATSLQDWDLVDSISRQFPDFIIPSYGIHPWWLVEHLESNAKIDWKKVLVEKLQRNRNAGIGECGLDKGKRREVGLNKQQEVLLQHLQIAEEMHCHITLHCVGAYGRLLNILRQRSKQSAQYNIILHSFQGDSSLIEGFAAQNCYFSFSGRGILDPNEVKSKGQLELAAHVPQNRLLVESDAEGNSLEKAISNVPIICSKIAEHLGISEQEFVYTIKQNALHAFQSRREEMISE